MRAPEEKRHREGGGEEQAKGAAEIERIFEAKMKPETIKSKVLRAAGSNEPPTTTSGDNSGNGGDSGDKMTATDVLREVEKRVQRGASIREAEGLAWCLRLHRKRDALRQRKAQDREVRRADHR
jgi:hypothetical protein